MSDKFITSRGFEIEFLSIPRAIQKFNLTHTQPEPPTYQITTALGAVETYPHDETTLEVEGDPEQTAKNKETWTEYQKQLAIYNEKFLRICFVKGILVHASMDEWIAEQNKLEIPIAEDTTERKIEWILDRVVVTEEDFKQITLGVMKASGAPEELLTQIESLFQRPLGKSERQDTRPIATENNGHEKSEEDLVLQPILRGESVLLREGNTQESIRQVEAVGQTKRTRRSAHKKQDGDLGTNRDE